MLLKVAEDASKIKVAENASKINVSAGSPPEEHAKTQNFHQALQ